jgi:hypothetical protein
MPLLQSSCDLRHGGLLEWPLISRYVGLLAPRFGCNLPARQARGFWPAQERTGTTMASATPQQGNMVPASRQQPVQNQVEIDDSQAQTAYTNFCRVTGTPEELILDFGLNSQPFGVPTEPIRITQRVITNFYTAKRLLQVLTMAVQRHESTFGSLETDVQRRVRRA